MNYLKKANAAAITMPRKFADADPTEMEYNGGFRWGTFAICLAGGFIATMAVMAIGGLLTSGVLSLLNKTGLIELVGNTQNCQYRVYSELVINSVMTSLAVGVSPAVLIAIASGIYFGTGHTVSFDDHKFPWW